MSEVIAVCSRSFSKNEELVNKLKESWPEVKLNDTGRVLESNELTDFLNGATRAIVGLEMITSQVLMANAQLRVISKYGVGLDNVELVALQRAGVRLGWVGGVNSNAVAELVVFFALALKRRLVENLLNFSQQNWIQVPGSELRGSVVGIIGYGHVGKKVKQLLSAFGCRFLVTDTDETVFDVKDTSVTRVSLDSLLSQADIITVHVPKSKKTENLIDNDKLRLVKNDCLIINTSRGGIVDTKMLLDNLLSGHIGGVALDVYEVEPPWAILETDALIKANVMFTPHIGGSTGECIRAMGEHALLGLIDNFEISDAFRKQFEN